MTDTAVRASERVATALVLRVLLFIAFASDAQSQAERAGDRQLQGSYRISVNVDLVVPHATVRDRKGRYVSDLREGEFEVCEDGIRQSIRLFRNEDIPVTVGLVVDHSGSMRRKLPSVIAAALAFATSSNPDDQICVVNFNENVTLGLPGTIPFTHRPDEFESAIVKAPATGQTALDDAIVEALTRLNVGSREKKVLIVISDSGDNASVLRFPHVLTKAGQSGALVYAIGIFDEEDTDRNPDALRRLARATGGEACVSGRLDEVVAICERIARDVRNQYSIGYVSTSAPQSGGYRSMRVVAGASRDRKLLVRSRAGYIAVGELWPVKDEGVE